MARFVPFAAVAGANCVNLPFMRWNEIRDGIAVFDKDGKRVGGKFIHISTRLKVTSSSRN